MFADLIFAGFIATAGAWHAPADTPSVQPAVIRSVAERADRDTGRSMLHLAADLGCPRFRGGYYDDYRGYPRRCRPRHAEPYHDSDPGRYDHHEDDHRSRDYDDRYGEHRDEQDYGDDRHSARPYRADPDDRLLDRDGRPYSRSREDDDLPAYRRGAYDPAAGHDPDFDRFGDDGPRSDTRARRDYYHRSSYHGYDRKKKATTTIDIITTTGAQPAV